MKRLIVNADDFGLSDHTVEWTIKGFECGALTSATLMAGMPATEKAVAYAVAHPQFSFGVHFYLVDETPLSRAEEIPSMIDPKTGKLWVTRQFILRNFAGLIKVSDLVTEMRAQFMALKNVGVPISHVDGHGHNHRLPQSIKALQVLKEEGLFYKVRRCQDVACIGTSLGLLSQVINGPMQCRLADVGFTMSDHFAMNAGHSTNPHWFSQMVGNLPEGVTEVGIHPGMDEDWRRVDTEECFALARDLMQKSGIIPVSFNDI